MVDYFKLLELQQAFRLSEEALEAQYFKLQSRYHPDKARNELDKNKYLLISSELNQAYLILKDKCSRAEHILNLNGYKSSDLQELDQEFLAKIFYFQLELEQSESAVKLNQLKDTVFAMYENSLSDLEIACSSDDYSNLAKMVVEVRYLKNLLQAIHLKISKANA